MIMVTLAKSWLTMVPLSRSWQIMIHRALVKIMARSCEITMICHGSYQSYHVKNSIEPFADIDRLPSWKACLWMRGSQEYHFILYYSLNI